jgi:hypothetical protein
MGAAARPPPLPARPWPGAAGPAVQSGWPARQGARRRGRAVLLVLTVVGLGGLAQDLGDFLLEPGQGAVGGVGGVAGDLGAVQRHQSHAQQPRFAAQPERGDQDAGQGLLVAGTERSDRHVVGGAVGGQHAEGEVLLAASFDLPLRTAPRCSRRTAARREGSWGRRPGGRARQHGRRQGTGPGRAGRPRRARTRRGGRRAAGRAGPAEAGTAGRGRRAGSCKP